MDRREHGRDRFESYLEVSVAGLVRMGKGGDQKDHQVCVCMAKGGDDVINQDGSAGGRAHLRRKTASLDSDVPMKSNLDATV